MTACVTNDSLFWMGASVVGGMAVAMLTLVALIFGVWAAVNLFRRYRQTRHFDDTPQTFRSRFKAAYDLWKGDPLL